MTGNKKGMVLSHHPFDSRYWVFGLVQAHAARIEADSGRPITEDPFHADILRQRINVLVHHAVTVSDVCDGLVVPAAALNQRARTLDGPSDDLQVSVLRRCR